MNTRYVWIERYMLSLVACATLEVQMENDIVASTEVLPPMSAPSAIRRWNFQAPGSLFRNFWADVNASPWSDLRCA